MELGANGRARYLVRRLLMPALAVVLGLAMAGTAAGLIAYRSLDGNISTDDRTEAMLGRDEDNRPTIPDAWKDGPTGPRNILLIGTDDRSGANAQYGQDQGSQRSDTTILLHLAADRKSATAVSIPRDLMTEIPSCERADGDGRTVPQFGQFNSAFQTGGAACTIRTVEQLTDIRIDHYVTIDFSGFKKMVDAVGGVEVCLPRAVRDEDAKLDLPAGRQTVDGEDALAYVRARKEFDDGSDTSRMGRQQQFLASLVAKVKSSGVLLNPTRLYPLLDAATKSITVDSGLDSLGELSRLAYSLSGMSERDVVFLTAPRRPWPANPNRDVLREEKARLLFDALREDRPIKVVKKAEGADGSQEADAADGAEAPEEDDEFSGVTAESDICGQAAE